MTIAVASDHAGMDYKNLLTSYLQQKDFAVDDLGAHTLNPDDDYPEYAERVALGIQQGKYEKGILICGSGVGVSVVANKFKGIRAAVCHDAYSAHQGVEHDNMNLLCMGARIIGTSLMCEIAEIYLQAKFSNEERHIRRFKKLTAIEERNFR